MVETETIRVLAVQKLSSPDADDYRRQESAHVKWVLSCKKLCKQITKMVQMTFPFWMTAMTMVLKIVM